MKTYTIKMNAGVEWWGQCEAESLEQAKDIGYDLARDALSDLRDYNFDVDIEEA